MPTYSFEDDTPAPGKGYSFVEDEAGTTAAPPSKKAGAADRVRAAAAGVNRGVYADLLGLPVDTVANVADLAKAGIGFAYNEGKKLVTGKPSAPPEWTEPFDRSKVVGTSDWLAARLNDGGLGSAINNPHPEDATSRILHMGGRVAGASVVPNSRAPMTATAQLTNAGMGALSGLSSGVAGEVAPEWAGLAGMLPGAAGAAATGGTRRAVRGDEAGRRKMEQRMRDLKDGGIDAPSAGLASGNRVIMGLENLLAQTPLSVGLYEKAGQANIGGMKGRAEGLRDSISGEFGPAVAGSAIQSDLKGSFKARVNATSRALNNQVAENVGPDFYAYPQNALDTARGMSAINPGAPATSGALQNRRIAGIAGDLGRDVLGTPIPGDPLMNAPTRFRRADGAILEEPPGIPFATLKNLRTSIGEEASSPAILGTPEGAQFKRLYGAMSEDMRQAVAAADRQNAGVDVGPLVPEQLRASLALNRANRFYNRAATRAEDLNGIANRNTPESAYGAVANSLDSGPSLYGKVRGAVSTGTRQKFAATIIDQLGTAKPGQQTADGEAWSPRTFLTNYAKLQENGGGDALFKRLPGGQRHAENLAKIAKASEMLGDASKVWANPSGTSAATFARGTLGTIGAGAFFAPFTAAKVGGGLLLANQVSKQLLLNPAFVNWLAKTPQKTRPAQMQSALQRLAVNSKIWGDKQFQQDVRAYIDATNSGEELDWSGLAE